MLVDRVSPWRRDIEGSDDLEIVLQTFRDRHPEASTDKIELAYEWASRGHEGQIRKSGEPYILHPLQVAQIVAEQGLDGISVAAALMHDSVEDTDVTTEEVIAEFGAETAALIDGCTKLDRIDFSTKEEQAAATMRKMLVAVAKDPRVLIIKLADRLHNMRTLAALPEWKQERTARETLHIYAPLAHRLGMQELKSQLEDLAFAAVHPKWYAEIDHMVAVRDPERDMYITQIMASVQARLAEVGISADVSGRPKTLWSIYEKMVVKGREFDDIYDLVGIRVICDSVRDCYGALGSVHAQWSPITGRFKDYIAMPKFNLYQSLHTTVIGPAGRTVEVQVRTREMDQRAEYGVAAHFAYKEDSDNVDLAWMSRILELSDDNTDPNAFLANLKSDLGQDEVLVFTPKGDVITLAVGATPVDLAYAVHTEVGHRCVGARVNDRLVAIDTRLQSGDTVEIFTSKSEDAGPSRDWLKFVATARAESKIKQWHLRERREDAIVNGREELIAELRRAGLPVQESIKSAALDQIAESMNYVDTDALYAAIGDSHVSPKAVVSRVARELHGAEPEKTERLSTTAIERSARPKSDRSAVGVHVEGLDDVWVRLSKCCTPVPPDQIVGFVTRGRGVSVHRSDCTNAESFTDGQSNRLIDVEWDQHGPGMFTASFEVKALDRTRLLGDVANKLAEQRINILAAEIRTSSDRVTVMKFEVELGDAAQLESVLRSVRSIDAVYEAYRVLPGGA